MKVIEALTKTLIISYPLNGKEVYGLVANELIQKFCPYATIQNFKSIKITKKYPALKILIADKKKSTKDFNINANSKNDHWMYFRTDESGNGEMIVSHSYLLYALYSLIKENWLDEDIRKFKKGKKVVPSFDWMRNLSDFFVGSLRKARHFDREDYIKQLARQGFSHVSINGLGVNRPFESGPPGDVYFWFYDYSIDLDQYVESNLLKGYYPPDYLQANLNFLKENAKLVLKYGLIPGLHINSPRSMPEEFWSKYGFLRGARIDHPRETFLPRYTLAMAHPITQEHYRELINKILKEIPEIGFIHIWTNDSGSGFEFVTSLYAGRNGGPYLIREWKNEDEIAKKAAENVLSYYKLLYNEAKRVNPDFRLICDLGPFYVERKYIVPKLGNGIDAGAWGSFDAVTSKNEEKELIRVGALSHCKIDLSDNNILGIPYPKLVYQRLKVASKMKRRWVLTSATPRSLSPFDINMEVLRAFQLQPDKTIEFILNETAEHWVGSNYSQKLVEIWDLVDQAVCSYPPDIPYSTFAFPWFRLWVRPFVSNIDAIPESERKYYEDFLIATFNNPTRVDLNNDMMWNFLTVDEAAEKKQDIDKFVLPPLNKALNLISILLNTNKLNDTESKVFKDLHDRLKAAKCFYTTMRNTAAWIESVHGYMQAKSKNEKKKYHSLTIYMILNELANTRELLKLWETSHIDFIPISTIGETLHIYGENFGLLLKKKIKLMEKHIKDGPYIDPNYMWRHP